MIVNLIAEKIKYHNSQNLDDRDRETNLGERMNIRNIVLNRLEQAVAEHSPMTFPEEVDDDIELDMFGLDSLAFMGLLTSIEKDIGYIPRAILEGDLYPETFGELVLL